MCLVWTTTSSASLARRRSLMCCATIAASKNSCLSVPFASHVSSLLSSVFFRGLKLDYSRLDLNVLKDSGAEKLVEGLISNATLKSLTFVSLTCTYKRRSSCVCWFFLQRRLSGNKIGVDGAKAIGVFLAANKSITELEYVATKCKIYEIIHSFIMFITVCLATWLARLAPKHWLMRWAKMRRWNVSSMLSFFRF